MDISISKIHAFIIMGIATLSMSAPLKANHIHYSIEYSNSSEKGPSLANAQIRGQLFRGGNPAGFVQIKTDPNKEFTIARDYGGNIAIAVFSIEGQNKLNLQCNGNGYPGSHKIVVKCYPTK
ncbi:MAG: hypothetical protein HYX61_07530 [Gammaproteobacteria bacterium]|jgi:hypothetical protein|nr:hypothetical protein [Gammaproteobacteria bacterium]